MNILRLFPMGLLLFWSCSGSQKTSTSQKQQFDPAPTWVSQRPHDSGYYIGVGSSNKKAQPLDFQSIAKKNALNDLATEISVRVQGESTMNTQEYNKAFSEDFMSTIKTSTDTRIEDFEVAGIWENENEYWVYYRLNKGMYQSKIREKKLQALRTGYDLYEKGKTASFEGNLTGAFDLYMHGLFAMKDYWSEPNEMETTSGKIFLDNELFTAMRSLFSDLKIDVPVERITLSSQNGFRQELKIIIQHRNQAARAIPVSYSYERETFMKPVTQLSSDLGEVKVIVEKVAAQNRNNQLRIFIDPEAFLAADLDKTVQKALIKGFRSQQSIVPIDFVSPSFFVELAGNGSTGISLNSDFCGELQKKGFRVAASKKEANYHVTIGHSLKSGGSTDGFVTAYLDLTIEVIEVKSGHVIYRDGANGIKGVGLNDSGASADAYKRAREKIEQQILPGLFKALSK